MQIDLTAPEGNTFAILGITISYLRQIGTSEDDISKVFNRVMRSHGPKEARAIMAAATNGWLTFINE